MLTKPLSTLLFCLKILIICILLQIQNIQAQPTDTVPQELDTSDYYPHDYNFNLIVAANKGYGNEVIRLLNLGADINSQTYEGVTALMYAVQNEDSTVVKILLLNGADPNNYFWDLTPPLITAVISGNLYISELLIRNNADINTKDEDGKSALHNAAAYGLYEIADMLLYYGADINIMDAENNTPLLVAAYYGYSDIVHLLVEKGANTNLTDFFGFTPLHVAIQNNNTEIVQILLDKGDSLNIKTNAGYSPLSIAVLNNNVALTDTLISKGSAVNDRISYANYPLNLARRNKNDTIIQILKVNQAKYSLLPDIGYSSINFETNFNGNDFMLGGGISIYDIRYGLSAKLGLNFRIPAHQITLESEPNQFYQYWERRSMLYLGITERVNLLKWKNSNRAIGLEGGFKFNVSFGSYRGVTETPSTKYILSPLGTFYYRSNKTVWFISYEFTQLNTPDIGPNRITLGLNFLIASSHVKQPSKKVLWYL